jgi:2-isopropylmalate synthase
VLGKHSGRHALGKRCEQLGYQFSRRDLDQVYKRFVALADQVKRVEDRHLLDIVRAQFPQLKVPQAVQKQVRFGVAGTAYGND